MSKGQLGGPGVKKIAAGTGMAKKGRGGKTMVQRKTAPKKPPPSSSDSSDDADSEDDEMEGEGPKEDSSSSDGSSSDSDSSLEQFDDGLDEDLVGDEEDQKKLNLMNEAEREQEVFKRYVSIEVRRSTTSGPGGIGSAGRAGYFGTIVKGPLYGPFIVYMHTALVIAWLVCIQYYTRKYKVTLAHSSHLPPSLLPTLLPSPLLPYPSLD